MLFNFLETYEKEILTLAEEKTLKLAGDLPSSDLLKKGLEIFYTNLIGYLKDSSLGTQEEKIVAGASEHGSELMRLNYTLSHVVHAYGAICQAVTEFAQIKNASISTLEFNELNLCLDIAIAAAVSEFQYNSVQVSEQREVQHLGFLVHELRNALSSATVAHEMITQGLVGTSGSTAKILKENLIRMRNLIDRSLSEIRMRADPTIYIQKFQLNELVDKILFTARIESVSKKQVLRNELVTSIHLETDRQLLLSAIANLIQNAVKYTKVGGTISIRAAEQAQNVIIEIEDEAGGIKAGSLDQLFKPFTSGGQDQSGLGLGLTIVKRAMDLLSGKVSVENNFNVGSIFKLEIPKKLVPQLKPRPVPGEQSAQPHKKDPKADSDS